ncbi:MAG: hypothetical protein IK020_00450 [Clostridiales bacterium]|nr:hypothetical protein [Clostridiales bacterium]
MKKHVHPSYLKTLITTAAILLVAGVCCVTAIDRAGKKKVEDDLDETLGLRIRKGVEITEFNDFYIISSEYTDIEDLYTYYPREMETLSFLSGEPEEVDTDPVYHIGQSAFWASFYSENGDMDEIRMTIIADENGDQITFANTLSFFTFNGYSYCATVSLDDAGEESFDYGGACNLASQRNLNMNAEAEEILSSDSRKGWCEDYRYFVLSYRYVEMGEDQPLRLVMDLPYEDGKHYTEMPEGARVLTNYKYIYFMDGAEPLAAWRAQTRENIRLMLCTWLALTGAAAIFIYIFLRPKRGVNWAMADSNGHLVEEGEPKQPESGASAHVRAKGKISGELARELLTYISQSESSMGPNEYLDQMRTLIEERTAGVDVKTGSDA